MTGPRAGRARRLLVGVGVSIVATVGIAGRADAGAGLQDTSPRPSAVLEAPPTELVFDFDGAVEQGFGTVSLFDARGAPIALEAFVDSGDDSQVVVPVGAPSDLGAGVYVVVYRLVSVDGQPVAGAYSFQVGASTVLGQPEVLRYVLDSQPPVGVARSVGRVFGAASALAVAGMVVLAGAWVMAWCGSAGAAARRIGWVGLAVAVASTLVAFAMQTARVLGGGVGDAVDPSAWSDLAGTRYGALALVRVALLGVAVLPLLGLDLGRRTSWRVAVSTVSVALAVALGAGAHAGGGRWPVVGIALAVVHVAGVAVWLGTLVHVAVSPTAAGVRVAGRLGDLAIPAVVVSGLLQTWRLLPDGDALSDTTYGRLVVAKVAVVVVLVVLAALARSFVRSMAPGTLRPVLVAEAILGLGVLAIGAGLVSVTPERLDANTPAVAVVSQDGYVVTVTVTPAQAGANDVHLTVGQPVGSVAPVQDVTLRIARPDLGVPATDVVLSPEGPSHWSAFGVTFAAAGSWSVEITVVDAGTTVSLATTVDVRGP